MCPYLLENPTLCSFSSAYTRTHTTDTHSSCSAKQCSVLSLLLTPQNYVTPVLDSRLQQYGLYDRLCSLTPYSIIYTIVYTVYALHYFEPRTYVVQPVIDVLVYAAHHM